MADPMKIRAVMQSGRVEVKILMSHQEETGLRKGADGELVPAHFISNVSVSHAGREVLRVQWGRAISKNPFLQFAFRGAARGDELTVTWIDNLGDTRTDRITIA
ncbi:MAG TPA: thiosulfate oxidation carrier complex protein SoxZ [Burkholderiaceae bacterium]|nr:thiosulfate oxidation carrier complex protein SoxZ [Burkholderiaceae bacterium]